MKTLATIGDDCVDIYPQLNKASSGSNAVNVTVYCTRHGTQPECITWVGDNDYGTELEQDLARMGADISHARTKRSATAQTRVELHGNDRVFDDYTEGMMANFTLSEKDYAWLAQYDIVHAVIWGHAGGASLQLHAAGKLTTFDLSGKQNSPFWQILVPHLNFAFAPAPQKDGALHLKMKAIVARGAGVVIVTLGENGSIAWNDAQFWYRAPESVTAIDTMGTGGPFIAGFLCGWSVGMTLPQAIAQGMAHAAKIIQYHSAWQVQRWRGCLHANMLLPAEKRPYNPSNSFFTSGSIMLVTDRYSRWLPHAAVRQRLLDDIAWEIYQTGQQTPTESKPCTQYNISCITIRKAISDLMADSVLICWQDKGTFA